MPKPKAPETIYQTWDELARALRDILETWNTETLLYLSTVEGNQLVRDGADEILSERGENEREEEDLSEDRPSAQSWKHA